MKEKTSKIKKAPLIKDSVTKKANRDMSLQEIGDALDLTRMRICQLEKSILEKVRVSGSLDEFMNS